MNTLRALAGLFSGVNSGIGGILAQRAQEADDARQARAVAVQEEQNKRLAMADEFNRKKAAYEALVGGQEYDAETAKPFMGTFPMLKLDNGKFSKPKTFQNQIASEQASALERKRKGLELFQSNPSLSDNYENAQKLFLAYNLDPNDIPKPLERVSAEAQAEYAPKAEDSNKDRDIQLQIANLRANTDRYQSDKMLEGREITSEGSLNRLRLQNELRPVDSKKFQDWFNTELYSNPKFKSTWMQAQLEGRTEEFRELATAQYRNLFMSGE